MEGDALGGVAKVPTAGVGTVKLGKNSIFSEKGKTVIYHYSIGGKSVNFIDIG